VQAGDAVRRIVDGEAALFEEIAVAPAMSRWSSISSTFG
jgi:hypothetical protein